MILKNPSLIVFSHFYKKIHLANIVIQCVEIESPLSNAYFNLSPKSWNLGGYKKTLPLHTILWTF
jgi:hypothetical protein